MLKAKFNISNNNLIYKKLKLKTKSVNRDSKARRSLGNIYALKVLIEDFLEDKVNGSSFSELLERQKKKPFGSKIQNHPLDNRLNDEFRRKFGVKEEMLPVQGLIVDKKKYRKISSSLISDKTEDPIKLAKFVDETIESFITTLTGKQTDFLNKIENLKSKENYDELLEYCLNSNSDARLFEIFAYVVLEIHYSKKNISITIDNKKTSHKLSLHKTGRTNANDGGIDYVLKPLGRFFQVTETLDFKKYFLDFTKLNRFPITFVIKVENNPKEVMKMIKRNAQNTFSDDVIDSYMNLFEEVITSQTLREYYCKAIYFSRGIHFIDPLGKPEQKLAQKYNKQAIEAEDKCFLRLSKSLRDLANKYEKDAERIIDQHKGL